LDLCVHVRVCSHGCVAFEFVCAPQESVTQIPMSSGARARAHKF
jgi:hypothetical protein